MGFLVPLKAHRPRRHGTNGRGTRPSCRAEASPLCACSLEERLAVHGLHGLIKKVAHGYKYYATTFGKDILTAGLKLRELVIIPQLAYGSVA